MLPAYIRRMIRRGGYACGFGHRFGLVPLLPVNNKKVKRIWIQAVSVGEIQAIEPIIQQLSENNTLELIITCTTSTAYAIARERYAEKVLHVGIFPLDFWPCSSLAWRRFSPDVVVLMETELWPEHIHQAKKRKVPVIMINGRLSDRSFARYLRVRSLARWILRQLDLLLVATEHDYKRFRLLGARRNHLFQTGNLKLDVEIGPSLAPEAKRALLAELGFLENTGNTPLVVLGSSTWPGEEAMLLDVLRAARKQGLRVHLLLVPRHMERRRELQRMLECTEFRYRFRSQPIHEEGIVDVYVGDTTGELRVLTQVADVAWIGNSLPPNEGGQTPIEAAGLGIPLVYGPAMSNFKYICASLEEAHAAIRTDDITEAQRVLLELLNADERRVALSAAARAWHANNRGAAARTLEHLYRVID
jgi:3-deoxy-D-manno-octulosonic-acid transferase